MATLTTRITRRTTDRSRRAHERASLRSAFRTPSPPRARGDRKIPGAPKRERKRPLLLQIDATLDSPSRSRSPRRLLQHRPLIDRSPSPGVRLEWGSERNGEESPPPRAHSPAAARPLSPILGGGGHNALARAALPPHTLPEAELKLVEVEQPKEATEAGEAETQPGEIGELKFEDDSTRPPSPGAQQKPLGATAPAAGNQEKKVAANNRVVWIEIPEDFHDVPIVNLRTGAVAGAPEWTEVWVQDGKSVRVRHVDLTADEPEE